MVVRGGSREKISVVAVGVTILVPDCPAQIGLYRRGVARFQGFGNPGHGYCSENADGKRN
jgi:hypothetical protein